MARAHYGQRQIPDRRERVLNRDAGIVLLVLGLFLAACPGKQPPQDTSQRSTIIQPEKWWENLPRPVYASLEKVKSGQPWFEVYKLNADTFAIYEPYQFEEAISYLVMGTERGILIDTGTGIGDLKTLVQELTDRPVSVVNTHTHWDHIGDNHQFDDIACFDHPDCTGKLLTGVGNKRLRESITGDAVWKPLPETLDPSSWEIPPVKPTGLLADGDIIDPGERVFTRILS